MQSLNAHIAHESYIEDLESYTIKFAKHKLETTKTELHLADHFFESIRGFEPYKDTGVIIINHELIIHLQTALNSLKQISNDFDKNKKKLIAELKKHGRFITVKSTRCFGNPCDAYHFKFQPIQISNY